MVVKTLVKYGLRIKETGEMLGVCVQTPVGEYPMWYDPRTLEPESDLYNMWLVDERGEADRIRNHSNGERPCSYTPSHDYEAGDLEVVKVTMSFEVDS